MRQLQIVKFWRVFVVELSVNSSNNDIEFSITKKFLVNKKEYKKGKS